MDKPGEMDLPAPFPTGLIYGAAKVKKPGEVSGFIFGLPGHLFSRHFEKSVT